MANSMTKKMVLSNKRACVEVCLFRSKQVKNPENPLRTGEDAVRRSDVMRGARAMVGPPGGSDGSPSPSGVKERG